MITAVKEIFFFLNHILRVKPDFVTRCESFPCCIRKSCCFIESSIGEREMNYECFHLVVVVVDVSFQ